MSGIEALVEFSIILKVLCCVLAEQRLRSPLGIPEGSGVPVLSNKPAGIVSPHPATTDWPDTW